MTAGAPAHEHHAVGIDQALPDERVDAADDVPRHLPEIPVENAAQKRVAVTSAAPVIRTEHEPAPAGENGEVAEEQPGPCPELVGFGGSAVHLDGQRIASADRKSTRLNSSHLGISYAV